MRDKEDEQRRAAQAEVPPTTPAKAHGRELSKGANTDVQLQKEDEERLRQKDESKKAKSNQ